MDNIFYRTLLNDKIKIEPKYVTKDFRKHVLQKLKSTMEGVCTKHGYIKEGSVEIYKVSPGNVDLVGLNGYVVFDTYYYADVCNPLVGGVVKATVVNVNKFGILADVMGILEIIIAKSTVSITHDTGVDLDAIKIGDTVMVEIVGKKFELFDKKISVVGRIVSDGKSTSSRRKDDKEKIDYDDDVDDVLNEDGMDGGMGSESSEGEDSGDDEEENMSSEDGEMGYDSEGGKDATFFDSEEEDGHEDELFYSDDEDDDHKDDEDDDSEGDF